jgi:hypothetical protein
VEGNPVWVAVAVRIAGPSEEGLWGEAASGVRGKGTPNSGTVGERMTGALAPDTKRGAAGATAASEGCVGSGRDAPVRSAYAGSQMGSRDCACGAP